MSLFSENEVDGEAFFELTEADIMTITKAVGVVKRIVRLQRSFTKPSSAVSVPAQYSYPLGPPKWSWHRQYINLLFILAGYFCPSKI